MLRSDTLFTRDHTAIQKLNNSKTTGYRFVHSTSGAWNLQRYTSIHIPFQKASTKSVLTKKKTSSLFWRNKKSQGSRRQTALLHNGFHRQLQNATLWGDDDPLFLGHLQRDGSPINRWTTPQTKRLVHLKMGGPLEVWRFRTWKPHHISGEPCWISGVY